MQGRRSTQCEIDMIEEAAAKMARRLNSTYVANPEKRQVFEDAISSFPALLPEDVSVPENRTMRAALSV